MEGCDIMLLSYLQEKYSAGTPIFLSDLVSNSELSNAAIRQGIKRLVDCKALCRYSNGVYYFPKSSKIFKEIPLDVNEVVANKYIKRNNMVFGYYSGITLANLIGLTTQISSEICIVTNKEKSRGRDIKLKSMRIRIKAPKTEINNKNQRVLQVLDLLTEVGKYSEYSAEETNDILKNYITRLKISKKMLLKYLSLYPNKTSKKLLETGVYDVLT